MQLLLNAGGPDRVSRVEMADAVAQFRGYDTSLIKAVSASTVCVMLHLSLKFCDVEFKAFHLSFDVNLISLVT